ncbi:MAG TPA: dTDP-glucose 4,6-dehydratase [Candidatus Baltobacteraceae bacterium]|nr:dTDP-glucose 4,6-dehydratase [Candidatus Baltobacteraceae bacterium]
MRVLVTGGAGFIGANFIHYWTERHPRDEIINIDKLTYAADPHNLDGINKDRYTFVRGDIADRKLMMRLVKDVDAIVNFAAESHVDNSINDSTPFVHSNFVGVHSILEAVRKYERRFHQVSTDEVYGSLPLNSKKRFNESSPYNPRNPYSATKAAADHLVRAFHNTYNIPATISNCSNNYGPYQHYEKLIPKSVTNALQNRKIPIHGSGMQVRDWIYVEDHCSGIEAVLKKGKIGETYLISAGCERRNVDVVDKVLKMVGKPTSLMNHVADRPGGDMRYAIDASKIRKELGWKHRYSFDKGMKITVDYYKNRFYSKK